MTPFDDFEPLTIPTVDGHIFLRRAGHGPPLLLLHGFPETHLMWRDVAPHLTDDFLVLCPDLRGYGGSGCPPSDSCHEPYSKRAMASELREAMAELGFLRFGVAGHDRGGRVAYRLALDSPETVRRLAVLDVLPGEAVWARADDRFALGFWPWSLLAQPSPLPECILAQAADAIIGNALGSWGSPAAAFPPEVRAAYVAALEAPAHAHAICEEYRAATTKDRDHDREDRVAGRRIACPLLALWSRNGALESWYRDEGGPLKIWRDWADDVQGHAVEGGHFFPEEQPEQIAATLRTFFSGP